MLEAILRFNRNRKLRRREKVKRYLERFGYWFYAIKGGILVATAIIQIHFFPFVASEFFPYTVPRYVISDGNKTVVFEAMVHIGSPEFYQEVAKDVVELKEVGALHIFEGVRPSETHPDAAAKVFASIIPSGEGNPIQDISEILGTTTQDDRLFLDSDLKRDLNADVSFSDIAEHIDSNAPPPEKHAVSLLSMANIVRSLPSPLKHDVQFIARGMFCAKMAMTNFKEQDINQSKAIVDMRDAVLAKAVKNGPSKMVITYGEAHFKGMLSRLQQEDKGWHIVEERRRRVLKSIFS